VSNRATVLAAAERYRSHHPASATFIGFDEGATPAANLTGPDCTSRIFLQADQSDGNQNNFPIWLADLILLKAWIPHFRAK